MAAHHQRDHEARVGGVGPDDDQSPGACMICCSRNRRQDGIAWTASNIRYGGSGDEDGGLKQ